MLNSTGGIDAEQIAGWLNVLVALDSTVEMRILYESGAPHVRHYTSTKLQTMASDALRLGKGAKGVYWMMNPLPLEWSSVPAKDADIERRRWLLIDCDPKRLGTVSSTEEEKEAAERKMAELNAFLANRGWPAPILADSGNGWHLLYRIDLPGEDARLVHRLLQVLAQRFDDEFVSIDTKVANASRICKLYGTISAKGPNSVDRPHRVSKILSIPEQIEIVPVKFLEEVADDGDAQRVTIIHPDPYPVPDAVCPTSHPEAIERAREYLAGMKASISGDRGHDKLLRAASVLVNDFRLADKEALDLLECEFNPRCIPLWDVKDIRRKIDEAKKNPPNRRPMGMGKNATTKAIVVRLSDVKELQVEWLWPNRIPLGKLTLLAGDPGLGKSFVTVDMAARVSTGTGWPDCQERHQPVGSVVMFNCEDDIADTVLPRLKLAGGDPSKVIALQGVVTIDATTGERHQRGFSLDVDLPKLIDVLEDNRDVRLVVIDPVSGYCGERDSHKNAEIRGMLSPLAEIASKYRIAIVMVTHLAKGNGGKAVYRAMGSLAFAAAARAVWYIAKDHDDDQRRLILMAKSNVCEEETGLAFRLEDGMVRWEERPITMTADEHLAKEIQPDRKQRSSAAQGEAVQQARDWLVDTLTGRSIMAKAVYQLADHAEISLTTLKRAKRLAGVISQRIGFGPESVVWWTMPPPEQKCDQPNVHDAEVARLFP